MGILKLHQILLLGSLALLLSACGPDKSELAEKAIRERVQNYRNKRMAECRAGLFQEAERIVDSLLLLQAQQEIRDSLSRTRPTAPGQPADVPPIDTLKVKPIF
jgi:hypothetical protein